MLIGCHDAYNVVLVSGTPETPGARGGALG